MDREGLAKFFTEQPGWRWMPGMHDMWGRCAVSDASGGVQWVNPYNPADQHEPHHLPDLTDPATIGCIVQLVADAHGCNLNDVSVVRTTGGVWSVWIHTSDTASHRVATHLPSRVEALAMALQNGGEE
jgi:hypothetical protein